MSNWANLQFPILILSTHIQFLMTCVLRMSNWRLENTYKTGGLKEIKNNKSCLIFSPSLTHSQFVECSLSPSLYWNLSRFICVLCTPQTNKINKSLKLHLNSIFPKKIEFVYISRTTFIYNIEPNPKISKNSTSQICSAICVLPSKYCDIFDDNNQSDQT